ncbi:MAG TPA: hypothetical protein VIX35_03895, partial [Vicinamibacterales bacterium]
ARRRRGEPVLPLAFGEAGLPAHRMLREALAEAAGCNAYGIRELYDDRGLTRRLGANARAAGLLFDRAVQVERYAQLLETVTRPRASRAAQPATGNA